MPPQGTIYLGKALWSTEQHIGELGSYGGCDHSCSRDCAQSPSGCPDNCTFSDDLPSWDYRAAAHLAWSLNQGYVVANMTSTLIWTPIYSWYEHLLYPGKGLMIANTPWSGWYNTPDSVWMIAHTTQFAQPGWLFSDTAGTKLLADGRGSVVSYVSPSGKDLSIVIETTKSNASNTVQLKLTGAFASLTQLYRWQSKKGALFRQQGKLTLTDGLASLVLPPAVVVTLTTTTGQTKGGQKNVIPPRTNFTLPWKDNFDAYADDTTPKYTSDLHGVFTVASHQPGGGNKVLQQRTALNPTSTAGQGSIYASIIGDGSWIDYEVSITARLPKDDADTPADVVDPSDVVCQFNETVGRCGGLTQVPAVNATTEQECEAVCCARPGNSCETWQWCPHGVNECDTKWAKSGRCWVGPSCDRPGSATGGWKTAARGKTPAPPQPPLPAGPFLFLASHTGLYKDGSTCVLSGKPLPGECLPGITTCCPTGKGGLRPTVIHSSKSATSSGASVPRMVLIIHAVLHRRDAQSGWLCLPHQLRPQPGREQRHVAAPSGRCPL